MCAITANQRTLPCEPQKIIKHFGVQTGIFTTLPEAMKFREQLARHHSRVRVKTVKRLSGEWHQVGSVDSKEFAQKVAEMLKKVDAIFLTT